VRSTSRRLALIIVRICAIPFPFAFLVGYEIRKLVRSSYLAFFPDSPLPVFTNYVFLVAALLGVGLVVSLLAAIFIGRRPAPSLSKP
jgi:hypothetical protein